MGVQLLRGIAGFSCFDQHFHPELHEGHAISPSSRQCRVADGRFHQAKPRYVLSGPDPWESVEMVTGFAAITSTPWHKCADVFLGKRGSVPASAGRSWRRYPAERGEAGATKTGPASLISRGTSVVEY